MRSGPPASGVALGVGRPSVAVADCACIEPGSAGVGVIRGEPGGEAASLRFLVGGVIPGSLGSPKSRLSENQEGTARSNDKHFTTSATRLSTWGQLAVFEKAKSRMPVYSLCSTKASTLGFSVLINLERVA